MKNPPLFQENRHPTPTAPTEDEEEPELEASWNRRHASMLARDRLESSSHSAANNSGEPSDPLLQENRHVTATPTAPTEDEALELEAARNRHRASMIVRDHLESHAANNPGASSDYVTWIATLHPENADIAIDQRFFIPGNPWWTIYEDTKIDQIPTATAVPVLNDNDDDGFEEDPQGPSNTENEAAKNSQTQTNHNTHFCLTCSPVSLAFAVLVDLAALIAGLNCEIMALLLCYFPSKLFFHASELLAPPNLFTCLFHYIFRLLYCVLSFCDSVVLLMSVFVTEVVALTAFLVGFCTGGVLWAHSLHQQIRRLGHGIRILFRKNAANQKPPRHFCGGPGRESAEASSSSAIENVTGAGGSNNDIMKDEMEDPIVLRDAG